MRLTITIDLDDDAFASAPWMEMNHAMLSATGELCANLDNLDGLVLRYRNTPFGTCRLDPHTDETDDEVKKYSCDNCHVIAKDPDSILCPYCKRAMEQFE